MSELDPITRREIYLAKAGGQSVETPPPITREEIFLDAINDRLDGIASPTQEQVDTAVEAYFEEHSAPYTFTDANGDGNIVVTGGAE